MKTEVFKQGLSKCSEPDKYFCDRYHKSSWSYEASKKGMNISLGLLYP